MMPTEVERLANETLEFLCHKYPYKDQSAMRACFEIFRNEIVFKETNEIRIRIEQEAKTNWAKVAYRWE
jgi:hypothetical protein